MTPINNHAEAHSPPYQTAAEAGALVSQGKRKDPNEVLGIVSQSGLGVAIVQATFLTVLVLIGCTVGPYVWSKQHPAESKTAADKEAQVEKPEPPKPAPPKEPTKPETGTTKAPPDKAFLDKIGATDTKPANPAVNPLDKSADDLLKDIDKK